MDSLFITSFLALVIYTAFTNQDLLGKVEAVKIGESLANLRLSSVPYLPSHWMAELMNAGRNGDWGRMFLYLALIWSTALFFLQLSMEFGNRWYADAWLWAQERIGFFPPKRDNARYRRKRLILIKLRPRYAGSIIFKEFHLFARDFSQWGQLVLILALVLFYVAHTKNFVFDDPASNARNNLAFFNVMLLGFIQATLSLRYTFPSISMEGRSFWVVASSGIGFYRIYFIKYYLHAGVLLCIGLGMGYLLNHILDVDPTLNLISLFFLFLFSFGFTSWCMGLGAAFHKFEATSIADVTSDTGTLVTMIFTLFYFAISIAFLARFALDHIPGASFAGQLALRPEMIVYSTIFLIIQTLVILLPNIYGLKQLEKATF